MSIDKEARHSEHGIEDAPVAAESHVGAAGASRQLTKVDGLTSFFGTIGGVLLVLCSAVIVYEIVVRAFFSKPTIWAFESSIYLFLLFVFCSMAYLQSIKKHIHVDLIISQLSERTNAIWSVVRLCCALVFSLILLIYGIKFAYAGIKIWETSPSYWGPPIWPLKIFVPLGAFLLSLQYIKDMACAIKEIKNIEDSKKHNILNNPIVFSGIFTALTITSLILFYYEPISAFTLLLLTLLLFGVDIFAALGLVGCCGLVIVFGGPRALITIPKIAYGALDNFSIVCIPLFVLCGELLHRAGAGEELYDMASKWLGGIRGGLAISTVVACTVFAAISASSVATALTIGLVALPALRAYGYRKPLAYGTVAAGGTLGIMIPPSGPMIIYSAVTEESLGKLFIAGVVPGLVIMAMFGLYIIISQTLHGAEGETKVERVPPTWKDRFYSIYNAKWALFTPIIIIGGIYAGVFTPMEAAAVAGIYSLLMMIGRRKITARNFLPVIRDAVGSSTALIVIIFGALVMGHFMTMLDLPNLVIAKVTEAGMSRWGVIVMLMFGFMIMGMFLEVISIMLITLPVVYPLIIALGFDGIWFAVMMILNMELALITPPVGLNLFVIQSIEEAKLSTVLRGVAPFFLLMLVGLVIVALFPSLSTWLPNLMVK